jgi:hypothetical protein
LIGGRGSAGEVAGERRRQSNGGAAAEALIPGRRGAELNNVRHGYLPRALGKVLRGSLGLGRQRRGELGKACPAAAAGAQAPASRLLG